MTHVLLRHRDIPGIDQLDVYKKNGGFEAFEKAVTSMKPSEVTDMVKSFGPARPRRRGLPHRHEVVVHRQQELAALCGGQCRRVRAGHVQGPRDHGGQSLPVPGRCGAGLPMRSARTRPTSTCAASSGRSRPRWIRRSPRWRRPAIWARICSARSTRCRSIRTSARAPTSAAKRPPCWNRSKANADSRASARRSPPCTGCTASRPWSTTSRR